MTKMDISCRKERLFENDAQVSDMGNFNCVIVETSET